MKMETFPKCGGSPSDTPGADPGREENFDLIANIGNLESVLAQVLTRISAYLGNPCEEGIDSPEWENNQNH